MTRYDVIEVKSFMRKLQTSKNFENARFLICLHIFSNIKMTTKVNEFTDPRLITDTPAAISFCKACHLLWYMQLNISTTTTLETEESVLCSEVAV